MGVIVLNALVGKLVKPPDLGSGDFVGSNPTKSTKLNKMDTTELQIKITILEARIQELEKENSKLKSDASWEADFRREQEWLRPREDGGYQGGA